jgi:two-component system sensor histidine kinase KdpD
MTREAASLRLVAGLAAVGVVVFVCRWWLGVSNPAIVSTALLLVVLLVAAASPLWVAGLTSVAAMLCFNFFFLPPVGTFTIADPQNWVALFAFLTVSLVASHLSAVARARTDEAIVRRDELTRLFDLSRDILGMTDSREAIEGLARAIARRFDLQSVAIALPRGREWDVVDAGSRRVEIAQAELSAAYEVAQSHLEFDAYERVYTGHRALTLDGLQVRLVPLRSGTRPIGLLAAGGRPVEAGTLDALAGVVAIAIERAQFLDERKAADLTRRSEELKTAVLASLGHDLRTPLTAIRVAADNVRAPALAADERAEQCEIILTEVERLSRLFENLLEMARIDAGAVATEIRWTHPAEIVAAASEQVAHTLRRHPLRVEAESDEAVRLDPRLTANALAHLLENAAQYAPAGSAIEVRARVTGEGLTIQVRDHGPGITPADLPHLFERFYRGDAAKPRASGTGMGLWIARGLLAAEHGRVWAENAPDGGALLTVAVPAAVREAVAATDGPTA